MEITVHGVGYVGLVTGACFAEAGNHVVCFDVNAARIHELQQCRPPIYEPGLEELLKRNAEAGRLRFTTNVEAAVSHATVQFVAVATPAQENGDADLGYVLSVARNIAVHMQSYKLIVNKSTVPVNAAHTIRQVVEDITDIPFDVASNPEFLKESMAIEDFMKPNRVVLGVNSERATALLKALYTPFVTSPEQLMWMDLKSAELSKYASNAMLATRISFMNEMARLAEVYGANIEHIRQAMGMDPRIGAQYLHPGPGYGGSCFPKDMKALIHMGKTVGVDTPLLNAVEVVNHAQKQRMFEKLYTYWGGDCAGKTVALWGLAFKANTDDVRDSASIILVNALLSHGVKVVAYDRLASYHFLSAVGEREGLSIAASAESALINADAVIIMTDPLAFKTIDVTLFKTTLKSAVVFDARNMYDPAAMARAGVEYFSIGRNHAMMHKEHADETYS